MSSKVSPGITPTIANQLDETLLELCSIASFTGEEEAICDYVAARLAKRARDDELRRIGNSIVVPLVRGPSPSGAKRSHVALVGHFDTVRTENGPARIAGDRCFGAGASDMKSGLAAMMVLAETLPRDRLACDVTLIFYAAEEGPYHENELGAVLDQVDELELIDLAICLEPSDNRLQLGCTGTIHAQVTVEGKSAHSARPWQGESAITKAVPLLAAIGEIEPRDSVIDGLTYRTVTTITQLADGGRGRNVVPDRVVMNINHRFAPDTTLEQAQRNVLAIVDGRGRVEFTDLSPSAMPSASHPLVHALKEAGVRQVEPKQAWTDVARFAARGIPAVNFGPGENAQAHQKNESTSLQLLHEGYSILERWLLSLPG